MAENNPEPIDESTPVVVSSTSIPTRIATSYVFDAFNMPRISCFYHKGQTITNFCCCPQCLIPLCPLCVQMHTQEHTAEGTYPKLQSLELILNDIYQTMSSESNLFTDAFSDLTQHVLQMQQQADQTHKRLSEIKSRCIKIVEQFFHSLENEIYNKQKKNADNQTRDAEHLKAMVQERWESHMQFLEELNSTNSMKAVIPFYGSTILQDNSQYYQLIANYLHRFSDVPSDIVFDQNRASELSGHLSTLIKVKHNAVQDFLAIHQLPHPNISQSKQVNAPPPQIQIKRQKQTILPPQFIPTQPLAQSNHMSRQLPFNQPGYNQQFHQQQNMGFSSQRF